MAALTILQKGRLIDPTQGIDTIGNLWIQNGRIVKPGPAIPTHAQVYDLSGCWVMPGFIDMHVHLRELVFRMTHQSPKRSAIADVEIAFWLHAFWGHPATVP